MGVGGGVGVGWGLDRGGMGVGLVRGGMGGMEVLSRCDKSLYTHGTESLHPLRHWLSVLSNFRKIHSTSL